MDDEDNVPASVEMGMLTTISDTIEDVLLHESWYMSTDARKLLVPLSNVPSEYLPSLLRISKIC